MLRKIVQIATASRRETSRAEVALFALCNDGTLWSYGHMEWFQLIGVPQPTPAEEGARREAEQDLENTVLWPHNGPAAVIGSAET